MSTHAASQKHGVTIRCVSTTLRSSSTSSRLGAPRHVLFFVWQQSPAARQLPRRPRADDTLEEVEVSATAAFSENAGDASVFASKTASTTTAAHVTPPLAFNQIATTTVSIQRVT